MAPAFGSSRGERSAFLKTVSLKDINYDIKEHLSQKRMICVVDMDKSTDRASQMDKSSTKRVKFNNQPSLSDYKTIPQQA